MAGITGVHHIAVFPTADKYNETVDFYTKLLGFPVTQSWGGGEQKCLMVSCGDNSCMEIIPSETAHGTDGPLVHGSPSSQAPGVQYPPIRAALLLYYDSPGITSKILGFLPCIFCGIFRRFLLYCAYYLSIRQRREAAIWSCI